jgi:hypothetical protein
VICSPNNYAYDAGAASLPDGVIRITALADYDRWMSLDDPSIARKLRWFDRTAASAVRFVPDFRATSSIRTCSRRKRSAASPGTTTARSTARRRRSRRHAPTSKVCILCGTDQGYVGIIGSIISGITIANRYVLAN